ncbi:STAS domain-containing protein [Streptomyces coryli]|nr:STAS domain-containing protein [Streptomyces coryli]
MTGNRAVVALSGELDAATCDRIGTELDALTSAPGSELLVDLREVTFADCTGLSPLLRAQRRARARGGRVCLLCDCPRLLRTLRLVRLDVEFDIYGEVPVRYAETTRFPV